jgi:hypothetical protein
MMMWPGLLQYWIGITWWRGNLDERSSKIFPDFVKLGPIEACVIERVCQFVANEHERMRELVRG